MRVNHACRMVKSRCSSSVSRWSEQACSTGHLAVRLAAKQKRWGGVSCRVMSYPRCGHRASRVWYGDTQPCDNLHHQGSGRVSRNEPSKVMRPTARLFQHTTQSFAAEVSLCAVRRGDLMFSVVLQGGTSEGSVL